MLAVVTAITYGVADWCGGHAARRMDALVVTVVGQTVSLGLVAVAVGLLGDELGGVGWGALGGIAGLLGLVCFYSALAGGSMTVVAPVTAIVSLTVPVVVGVALGDRPRPVAWLGMLTAVIAVALVGGVVGAVHTPVNRRELVLAAAGGVGFGLIFVALAQAPDDSGMWPLLGARVASVALAGVGLLAAGRRDPLRFRVAGGRGLRLAVVAGLLDVAANAAYLAATRRGLLSVVAVVSSMYPVSTIALAVGIDRERVSRSQLVGMGVAVLAVMLVSTA